MNARPIALVSVTLALAGVAAGCGGDDEQNGTATTTTPPAASDTAPSTTNSGSPDDAEAPDLVPGENGEPPQGATTPSDRTIAETIEAGSDTSSLKTALTAAGLTEALEQPGPYTIFAPNNDAFAKLGSQLDTLLQPTAKSSLANILKFHVVPGELTVKDLKDDELLTTLQGTRLRVSKKGNTVTLGNSLGKAVIVTQDTDASNGVVHLVDTVLKPKD